MKTSQLILAVAVLMVMVFAITFAMNFFGGDPNLANIVKPPLPPPPEDLPGLVFETTEFPPQKNMAKEWELKKPGHADFWFTNSNQTEVKVGLKSKSCQCTEAELFLSNPEWDAWRKRNTRVLEAGMAAGAITTLYRMRQEADMRDRESQLSRHHLNERSDEGFVVPAEASGWIRLSWIAEKLGSGESAKAQQLTSSVWMHDRSSGPTQSLEMKLVMFPILRLLDTKETSGALVPAKSPQQLVLGTLTPRDLPRQALLVFGSPTRAKLALNAEAVKIKSKEGDDTFVVGQPVQLTRAETEKLEAEVQDGP